ncbi:concanavalin A-like lectin/glucanase [Durotheca rogersii]|uniref:concanavalin A-like lectin/glucanase n=1 Tax=Durotheca rogersii TaxID=419775 RepID=UPI002220A5C6|nr:concanavalin A-like lectin/glucanase [Durotheca rogersii]KAI5863244.1 concanavalin A-like lectin/glucanase [Durotheca rogersii]
MRFLQPSTLAFGLATATKLVEAQAQFLVNELSFGYSGRINDRGQATVPGFSIQGIPNVPEVLSNKVILTPPAPGNTRGAIWADQPNKYATWVADVDFRVNGPERGGGNLNIWLARRGNQEIGSASIYTVSRFDGLALVIDQHGGSGGMIRGFLNDANIDFKTHQNVDSLAFGHCNYAYRNLGRPSQIKLTQTPQAFRVEVGGQLCFESDKIAIPPGYYFGITAAAADNPDSFEIFKMVTMTENLEAKHDAPPQQGQPNQKQAQAQTSYGRKSNNQNNQNNQNGQNYQNSRDTDDAFDDTIPDALADTITSSKAQFEDLHNRLQSTNHHLSTIFRQVSSLGNIGEKRHEEVSKAIHEMKQLLSKLDRLDSLQNEITKLQRDMREVRNDIHVKVKDSEHAVKSFIGTNHGTMLEHVAVQSAPKHGKLIFIIIGSQVLIVAGYIIYERRKTTPKKYL